MDGRLINFVLLQGMYPRYFYNCEKTDFHILDLNQTIDLIYFISFGWFHGEKIFFFHLWKIAFVL